MDLRKFLDSPSTYLQLPHELKSAIEAITYIAEALQAEKEYEAVSSPVCHFEYSIFYSLTPVFLYRTPFLFILPVLLLAPELYFLFLPSVVISCPSLPISSSMPPPPICPCCPPSSSIHPRPAEGGLAVRCHGGRPHVPLDLCHIHHRGHLGHLCRCQLQPHAQGPLQIPVRQRDIRFLLNETHPNLPAQREEDTIL